MHKPPILGSTWVLGFRRQGCLAKPLLGSQGQGEIWAKDELSIPGLEGEGGTKKTTNKHVGQAHHLKPTSALSQRYPDNLDTESNYEYTYIYI